MLCNVYNVSREQKQQLKLLTDALEEYLQIPDDFEVEISIADTEEVRNLNINYRGVDSATDVLSFPCIDLVLPYTPEDYRAERNPETGRVMLGDVIICGEYIVKQAEEFGHSDLREFSFLVLHGLLHLLGFDHECGKDRTVMRTAEDKILKNINCNR